MPEVITLTREEFNWFRDVQIKPRWDWPATFSCNRQREVWLFVVYGHTPPEDRQYLEQGDYPVLYKIVERFLIYRPKGGRFHIGNEGVFLAKTNEQIYQFMFTE